MTDRYKRISEASGVELRYAALIRAYEFTPLVERAVACLRQQTLAPEKIIIVDSSKRLDTRRAFERLAESVVVYPDEEFNFSKAINVGVEANDLPWTLIFSSHVLLKSPDIIETGWKAAVERGIDVVSWEGFPIEILEAGSNIGDELIEIDSKKFNGRNGFSNCAGLVATKLLEARPFREEVFSAEDQEWARFYLEKFNQPILKMQSSRFEYLNPNASGSSWELKTINEVLAIGHYVNRRLIWPDRVLARYLRALLAMVRLRKDRAQLHFSFATEMLLANFRPPNRRSRYF